jgi:phytoene synthase
MTFAPASTAAADMAEVRRVVSSAGSSFAAGMRILPSGRRRAIHAVYAYCREIDDIADGDTPGADCPIRRASMLDRWEAELDATFAGRPATAIGAEIARACDRIPLPRHEFELLLEGMRLDAQRIVAPSADALAGYIRRVAGAVGILSMRCFGAWLGAPSERFALNLAHGLQLVNILRDVEEDAARGRLYLPDHVLDHACLPSDPLRVAAHPNLPVARAALAAEARDAFTAAKAEIPAHRRMPLVPALLMMGPYDRLLRRWEADWSRPPPRRSTYGKLVDGVIAVARPGA